MTTTIKIGSSVLDSEGGINYELVDTVCFEISQRIDKEKFLVVSSGALLLGVSKLGLKNIPKDMKKKQALCAIGQTELMKLWSNSFSKYGISVSQVLITHEDIELPRRARNIEDTITEIFRFGSVPVINENDTVSTEEIRFGDNDFISAYISILMGARRLIFITDIDGVLDQRGNVIKEIKPEDIDTIWDKISKYKGRKIVSSGGIISKLTASKIASEFGIECYIINGRNKENVKLVLEEKNPGTKILPSKKYKSRREVWIIKVIRGKGKIFVDKGAFEALKNGKSLLAAGIIDVEGNFSAGDIVEVYFGDKLIGKGISNYFSSEIKLIKGKKTTEIEKILGYKRAEEVIHRNNFVEIED